MKIHHLLVDELLVDIENHSATAVSTLYDFQEPEWVSPHAEREGLLIGPLTLLRGEAIENDLKDISIMPFPKRKLHFETNRMGPLVTYKDRWTIPNRSLYTIVFPKNFVPNHIQMTKSESEWTPHLLLGYSRTEQLFFHTIFESNEEVRQHIFDIEAQIQKNEKKYNELILDTRTIEGTNRFQELGRGIQREATTPDFWIRLLELGSKFSEFLT